MNSKIKKLLIAIPICIVAFAACFFAVNSNKPSEAFGEEALTFSKDSGVYDSSFQLQITGAPGAKIYYTTDGSNPIVGGSSTTLYSGPITIESMKGKEPVLTTSENASKFCDGYATVQNQSSLERAAIIRAFAVGSTGEISKISTRTYFVNNDISTKYKNCAVMSIVTDPGNLLNDDSGIYVLGTKYYSTRDIEDANFMQKGKDWERIGHMDFFDGTKTPLVSAGVGIRIHGGYSRRDQQKSFNVYFRDNADYGVKKLEGYELIPGAVNEIDGTPSNEFSNVMLRNGGNDGGETKFVDIFIQKMLEDRSPATQDARPCMLYLNGEYWGLYNLTEKYSDKFLETEYGVNAKNVIVYKDLEIDEGESLDPNGDAFNELMALGNLDMNDENNYNRFKQMVDFKSFVDYYAAEVYICNNDWWSGCNAEHPHNNIQFWKVADPSTEDPDNIYADGKWRYMYYDMEWSMGIYGSGQAASNYDAIKYHAMGEVDPNLTGWDEVDQGRTEPNGSPVFRAVFNNKKFRMSFANTLMDIRNWDFESNRAGKVLDSYASVYDPLIQKNRERWNSGSVSGRVSNLKTFIRERNEYVPTMLESNIPELSKGDRVNVTVTSGVNQKNNIKVNSIYPDTSSGWTGMYYRDYPIIVKAEKVSGKKFDHWEVTGCIVQDANASYTAFALEDKNATIKAVYENASSPDTSADPEEPYVVPRDLPNPTEEPYQPTPTPTNGGWNPWPGRPTDPPRATATPAAASSSNVKGYFAEFRIPFKSSKSASDKVAFDLSVQDAIRSQNQRIGKLNLFSTNSPYSDRREFGIAELVNTYPGDSAQKDNKTVYAVKKTENINIDGQVDGAWDHAKAVTLNNYIVKINGTQRNVWADCKVMWDEAALYILVMVTDNDLKLNDNYSQSDSIELYFDEDASDAANNDMNYGPNAFQYRICYNGETDPSDNVKNYYESGYNVASAVMLDVLPPGPTPTVDPNATPTPTPTATPTWGPWIPPTAPPTPTPTSRPTATPTKDPTAAGQIVTFDKDSHATVNVYKTQEYDNPDIKLINVTSAKSMDSATGDPVDNGGQVNFEIVCASGYVVDTMSVTPTENYKNFKGFDETGVEGIYRITKITGPVTVRIRTRSVNAEQTKYTATFAAGEHFTIDAYDTQFFGEEAVRHANATSAVARNSATGEIDATGEGQINFMVVPEKGYSVESVSAAPTTSYKNIKGPADTQYENAYRLTKVTGDLTVTVKVKAEPTAKPTATPRPGQTAKPGTTPMPGQTAVPGTTAGPGETAKPGTSAAPNGNASPTPTADKTVADQISYPKKVTIGQFIYTLTSETTAKISGCKIKALSSLVIPATIKYDGKSYKIIMVDNNAFKKFTKLKKVVIGKNVTAIGFNAFSGCKALRSVVIKGNKIKAVGKNAFKGTSRQLVIKVPKSKKNTYKKKFFKKNKVK